MRIPSSLAWTLALAGVLVVTTAGAAPSLDDYRHFRALSIDLVGRVPSRAELQAFEAPSFDIGAWVDGQLGGAAYADRLTRIYLDLLRLQLGSVFNLQRSTLSLERVPVTGPDGKTMYIYYRFGQRRARVETDADFCLTAAETGLQFQFANTPMPYPSGGHAIPVTQALLDQYTVVVKPWWLYYDYRSANPTDRFDPTTWPTTHPGFAPANTMLFEPDGVTPTTGIRVCREETQTPDTGHVYASGRTAPLKADGGGPPFGRTSFPPADDGFTRTHAGEAVVCATQGGLSRALDCGCGVGLERCMPSSANFFDVNSLTMPGLDVLGAEQPVDSSVQGNSGWMRLWWSEEARHLMEYVFTADRDMREILTAPYTFVNGPLAQFYRTEASSSCCGNGVYLGYTAPEALFDPAAVPASLLPHDARSWLEVANRGPNASGILTMPIFLTKFGTRRARAHALYTTFLCRDFIAPPNLQLPPSSDPNLMTRPGCQACHATLEPMATYFARITESDWNFLPPDKYPMQTSACTGSPSDPPSCVCHNDAKGNMNGACTGSYDPAFSSLTQGVLAGAYPDVVGQTTHHADQGPAGIAAELTNDPAFAGCVAQNVASSFLGRSLTPDDVPLMQTLTGALTQSGYHMRDLVRAMVLSDAYRHSNNLSSSAWRDGGAQ